jgi:hypothetical protein
MADDITVEWSEHKRITTEHVVDKPMTRNRIVALGSEAERDRRGVWVVFKDAEPGWTWTARQYIIGRPVGRSVGSGEYGMVEDFMHLLGLTRQPAWVEDMPGVVERWRAMETVTTEHVCLECGRPVWEHLAFYEVPTPEDREGLTEARFPGQPWRGLYCRPDTA